MSLLEHLRVRNTKSSKHADMNFKRISELLGQVRVQGSRSDGTALKSLLDQLSATFGIQDDSTP